MTTVVEAVAYEWGEMAQKLHDLEHSDPGLFWQFCSRPECHDRKELLLDLLLRSNEDD